MYCLDKKERGALSPLFLGGEATMLHSCLQGIMGEAWADAYPCVSSAQVITGDFCFFAGAPNVELVRHIPKSFSEQYLLMAPPDDAWAWLIEQEYGARAECRLRYATKKQPDCFDEARLRSYAEQLPAGYSIRRIDETLYHTARAQGWAKDLCSQYPTYGDYAALGLGFAAVYQGELVCGASSYTVCEGGIELQIDTKKEHRRKGLALACAATLILACKSRGIYPNWDAANEGSLAVAEKLGYCFDHAYKTYAINTFGKI